jgi:cystathionine beta-lyase
MTVSFFDQQIDRIGTWAEKYEARQTVFGRADVEPLWVADMDFATPPFVINALTERLAHPVLGYTQAPEAVAQSVCDWQLRRHDWQTQTQDLVWLGSVVSGLYLAVQALTQPDECVMVFTPVYPPFMKAVIDNSRQLVTVPLLNINQRYQLDFTAIESYMCSRNITLLLLANPHNPSGRVWSKETLNTLAGLCLKYHVKVVSDEVWSDLILDQRTKHIPFASICADISAQTVTLGSTSKTFNLAALQTGYALITNAVLRQKFRRQHTLTRASEPNLLGLHALQAAYSDDGVRWLADLLMYLRGNLALVASELSGSGVDMMMPEASYLIWLDFTQRFEAQSDLVRWCVDVCSLGLSSGTHFGEVGKGFMRLNMALPRSRLALALASLKSL